jgi:hypothetical protein
MSGNDQITGSVLDRVAFAYLARLLDCYREAREAEVAQRWIDSSRYHFDDGLRLALEYLAHDCPVDHPVWVAYSERLTEIAARKAAAEQRLQRCLAALKGVEAGFMRLCRQYGIDPEEIVARCGAVEMAHLERYRGAETAVDEVEQRRTYGLLRQELIAALSEGGVSWRAA